MEVIKFWTIVSERVKKLDITEMKVDWLSLKPLIQQLNSANATFIMALIHGYYNVNNGTVAAVPYHITDISGGTAITTGTASYRVNYQYLPLPLQYIIQAAVREMVNISQ